MRKVLKVLLLMVAGMMVFPAVSNAQFYNGSQMSFGKNRVQYKEFQWTFYKYPDYDIYFYLGGKELAQYTAKYVKENIEDIEDKLETGFNDRVKFIIFNNLTDLKQSNIGLLSDEQYNTGGITHIIGKKVFLYFDGNHRNFDKQIRAGLAQTMVNQLLYGTSVGSQIKNTSLFPFPDWYMKGLVSYISEDWSAEIDNRVKDGIITGKYKKFNQLTGEEATYAGHAFWRFIAEKYGDATISNIIYMAKVSRKLESGFLYILGISFKNLMNDCLAYYGQRYKQMDSELSLPEESLLKKTKRNTVYSKLKLSPDGNYAVYSTNRAGQYRVFLRDLNTGKTKKMMKDGFRLDDKVDYSYPLFAWHPTGQILSVIIEHKGEVYLYYYRMGERKPEEVILFQFEKVLDFAYSDDGRSMVMSAVQRGQSDIFVYDIGSNSYFQVTKDAYDDLYPRFIHNSEQIIFSSNRMNDTIRFERKFDPEAEERQKRYDLFLYKYLERDNVLRRVTKTPLANEIQAMEYENNYITFLSDANGIYNRYLGRFDSAISYIDTTTHYRHFTNSYAVTDYSRNILEQDVVPMIGKYGQIIYKDQKYKMQIFDQEMPRALPRLKLGNTSYMQNLINVFGDLEKSGDSRYVETGKEKPKKKSRGFSTVRQSEAVDEIIAADTLPKDSKIDINNYTFDTPGVIDSTKIKQIFDIKGKPLSGNKKGPPKRRNYDVEYFLTDLVTQIDFSYLNQTYQPFTGGNSPIYLNPGFNALIKVGVTDLLEDYRITGGVRLNLNLANNEYLFSYANLKKRLDKEIIFHRQSIENFTNVSLIRVYSHEVFYVIKWPFSPILAVKGTASFRNDMGVFLSTDAVNLAHPNVYRNWAGLKGELVYDNTRSLGINLFYGTRFKIFGEYYERVEKRGENLVVLGADFRNYQRISRSFIWANRFAMSTSFGNNKLIYYMGGVDNWLFPKFNLSTPIDFDQNYAYQTLATNLRGFNQNIRNGNSFAVLNSELRFPVFRYFANHPIKSDFLNNFQVVGFGDVGTAWTGLHPYSDENFLYTNHIEQAPLNITVKVQKDPIVGGFGFGARTRLLGYFIRADLAWGVEDYRVQPGTVFYFSLSLDF
ncbi:MAG: hypothetical protein GXO89_07145 [Chlorobi bacterium]|nr:hypothetical protein [Chlorobiota bacterium]